MKSLLKICPSKKFIEGKFKNLKKIATKLPHRRPADRPKKGLKMDAENQTRIKSVVLKTPITIKRLGFPKEVSLISLRPPTIRDLMGLNLVQPEHQVKSYMTLVSRLSGIDEKYLETVHLQDWMQLMALLGQMMEGKK